MPMRAFDWASTLFAVAVALCWPTIRRLNTPAITVPRRAQTTSISARVKPPSSRQTATRRLMCGSQ